MPEVWLPYGTVEVPINVKVENVAKIYTPNIKPLDENVLMSRIKEIEFRGKSLILLSETDEASAIILKSILNAAKVSSTVTSITVGCERSIYSWLKKACEGLNVDVKHISASDLVEYDTKIFISRVGLDPLFGFSGGAVTLLKTLNPTFMAEAFKYMRDSEPKPGKETDASLYAYSEAPNILGVEYIYLGNILVDVAAGELINAHKQISQNLLEICEINLRSPPEAIIASPGLGKSAATLASALNSLWNVARDVEGCVMVFFAECIEGLGSEALRLAATRDVESYLTRGDYVDGLEDIIYLRWLSKRTKVGLISTLPRYYVNKIGFDYIRSASDALPYIFRHKGSRVKIHIFPDAESALLTLTKEE
ncbi:MAG: hypothetical protein QXJ86_03665 [Nitrososphaerales archaeon]